MNVAVGLDVLLRDPGRLRGRRYGLLSHRAAVTAGLEPAHLALADSGFPPSVLFGPEHGYHGVEQDMVPSADAIDPWTGIPIRSLYGETAASLRPDAGGFGDLDLLVVDLQDVGARYYTYAATAVWAAEVALEAGCEVWVLDRPNPLGGERIEGNLRREGFESFVGAFAHPVRHGLTIGEIARLELSRRDAGAAEALTVIEMEGWRRSMMWPATGRVWIAPSPNMPTFRTAVLYPGICLVEGTSVSEGRGTTRPFHLVGAPDIDPRALAAAVDKADLDGVRALPTRFRPEFQKHAGTVCGGVELIVTDAEALEPVRLGIVVLVALYRQLGATPIWRTEPYEFETARPAIDLLAGGDELRRGLGRGDEEALGRWIASWDADERRFRERRRDALIYD